MARLLKVLLFTIVIGIVITHSPVVLADSEGKLFFNKELLEQGVGQRSSIELLVDTGGSKIGGVGAKLLYDPQYIAIEEIQPGTIFGDYPVLAYDNAKGKATISGIVSSPDSLYTGSRGHVATILVKSLQVGETTLNFDFTPGKTNDSNIAVTYGNGDILKTVIPLSIRTSTKIVAVDTAGEGKNDSDSTQKQQSVVEVNAHGPIPSQAPITSQSFQSEPQGIQSQPLDSIATKPENNKSASLNPFIAGSLVVITAIVIIVMIVLRRRKGSTDNNL